MLIRQCNEEDLEKLKNIEYKTFNETFRPQNKDEDIDNYLKQIFTDNNVLKELQNEDSFIYFIYVEDQLAGYLKLNINKAQTEDFGNEYIEIERIYVLNHYQKMGVGKELYNHALKIAKEYGYNKIWLGVWEHNQKAIQFYKKLGFEKIGEHTFYMGEDKQIDEIMSVVI